jgi:hypothetical protein
MAGNNEDQNPQTAAGERREMGREVEPETLCSTRTICIILHIHRTSGIHCFASIMCYIYKDITLYRTRCEQNGLT